MILSFFSWLTKKGLKCKVLATMPVYKMGQMFLYDAVLSRSSYEDFAALTLDDVDNAFDYFEPLKYSQHFTLNSGGVAIDITPYAAGPILDLSCLHISNTIGHMIGGTVWQLKKETDDIVYAVDYNHKKERFFFSHFPILPLFQTFISICPRNTC